MRSFTDTCYKTVSLANAIDRRTIALRTIASILAFARDAVKIAPLEKIEVFRLDLDSCTSSVAHP